MVEALGRMEGETKATRERLARFEEQVNNRFDRIETSMDRLIQVHLDAQTTQPASGRAE